MEDTNKLYGQTLYLLVLRAIETLPAPVTNSKIIEHLLAKHAPGMNRKRKLALEHRVDRVTRRMRHDGLVEATPREGMARFIYNELKAIPQHDGV